MFDKIGKVAATVAALAAVAFGASAIAEAASNNNSGSSSGSSNGYGQAAQGQPPQGGPPPGGPNGARPQHKPETPLTGDTAAKVKAAALDKIPGGTIVRVETDTDFGSPYEAHVRKPDGTEVQVLVNKQFEVSAVKAMGHR